MTKAQGNLNDQYPGWLLREAADSVFSVCNGSEAEPSFAKAMADR